MEGVELARMLGIQKLVFKSKSMLVVNLTTPEFNKVHAIFALISKANELLARK